MYELKVYFPNKDTFWLNVTEKSLDEFICYFDDEAVSGVIEIYCEKNKRVFGINRIKALGYSYKEISEGTAV